MRLLTLRTRRFPNPPGSPARSPLMRKTLGSVPRHRTSGRRFRPGQIQGGMTDMPRPIDRRDTRGASPEAIGTPIDAGIGCGDLPWMVVIAFLFVVITGVLG